jgi:hypothetical protein
MCKSALVSFVGSRVWIQKCTWKFLSLFCCVLCIGNGLCDELVTHSLEYCRVCVCVSNCVCDLWTSTNNHSSPQYGCSTTVSNINFTYRHSNSNRRLLPALPKNSLRTRIFILLCEELTSDICPSILVTLCIFLTPGTTVHIHTKHQAKLYFLCLSIYIIEYRNADTRFVTDWQADIHRNFFAHNFCPSKYLGISLRSDLNWVDQVNYTTQKPGMHFPL